MHVLSQDTQATLLLCGVLPGSNSPETQPLTPREFHRLDQVLCDRGFSTGHLLSPEAEIFLMENVQAHQITLERMKLLLQRGAAVALACDRWLRAGLWILSLHDESFPKRLRERLGTKLYPLLFGAGNPRLLSEGGLAVVGSRDADEAGLEFAARVGELTAQARLPLISGGAKGIDSAAMNGALQEGGTVIGVLANGLFCEATRGEVRPFLMDGPLVLCSPFSPEAPFSAGSAMARNKYVYALADSVLVVNSDYGSGGTWSGAQENLKHGWCPLFVREADSVPEGNRRLLKRGCPALRQADLTSVDSLLDRLAQAESEGCAQTEMLLDALPDEGTPSIERAATETPSEPDWQEVLNAFAEPRSAREVAREFGIKESLLYRWLKEQIEQGIIHKHAKPVRYSRTRHD